MWSLWVLVTVVASYLIGAIPFGYLVVRLVRGMDIRHQGSGNIGATNVGRVLGWRFFVIVLVLDFVKGAAPVLAAGWLCHQPPLSPPSQGGEGGGTAWNSFLVSDGLASLAGIAAIIGHMWPIYLGFRGGKGVATGAGVIVMLAPLPALVAVVTWFLVVLATRYVSLSSMAAAMALCLGRVGEVWPTPLAERHVAVTSFCFLAASLVIIRHRANLGRLWHGTEPKIGEPSQMEDRG